jgi:hypothetical protein
MWKEKLKGRKNVKLEYRIGMQNLYSGLFKMTLVKSLDIRSNQEPKGWKMELERDKFIVMGVLFHFSMTL